MTTLFGSGIKRREDPRFLTGRGSFVDDLKLPGLTYAAILRSPHAHARLKRVETAAAKAAPEVLAVYTGQDIKDKAGPVPCAWNVPNCDLKIPAHPLLAWEKVRYVGDGVAMVVATSRAAARDALELIEADYEPLPAVVSPEAATRPGAPALHPEVPNNIAFTWVVSGGDAEAAFRSAEVKVSQRIVQQRLLPNAMEARAAIASWNPGTGQLTLWSSSQNPHIHRFLCSVMLKLPEHKIRVISPDVGGGFGSKIPVYADEVLACFAAMALGRPVKWTEDRSENYQATIHGRDHVQYVELCGTKEGKITGLRTRVYAGLGAYASTAGPGVPTILHGLMYSGAYTIPNIHGTVYGVYTTTTPVDAYRGAGRPEATFLIERLVDLYAREIGTDPAELRRKNLIPRDKFPYTVATGISYDSGNYEAALDKALGLLDYKSFRTEQARARTGGRYLGVGVVCYTEICGLGPSQVAGAVGFGGGLYESAIVRVYPTGVVRVYVGSRPHGQGEETTFAQIVADEFGVPIETVEIVAGDTESTPQGWGTYGSRTTAVSGSAVKLAAGRVKEKVKKLAAHLLEASEGDLEWNDGRFSVKGSPDQGKSFGELALMANVAWNMPAGMEPGLEASAFFDPSNFVFPYGTHLSTVEVDAETGEVKVLRYIAVDDCGPQINPMIVRGQVQGGVVQGLGEALQEMAVYDEQGQLLTGTMMDYAVPRASQMPAIETAHTVTPSPVNPLGVKGIGEAGTIASAACLVNAVCDALAPLGIKHIDKPLTPARVWAAMQAARAAGGGGGTR
ncbi:MAG TPA: molybdopterin cofactor-binding domain-containing protein [Gemmatimonadales bacterium]|jgi:carbon-monoxide dehydrogenase large subunit|nr:molybdopterin cofactor-binding domain-containing protein [Gemmatimonadales bacterium]